MTDAKLPTDHKVRKETPVFTGVINYFPDAIVAVAGVSFKGNQQHNPGQELHWAKHKSTDHENCIVRHLIDFEAEDTDGSLHCDKAAWRALALSQMVHEARAAGMSYKDYIAKLKADAEVNPIPSHDDNPMKGLIDAAKRDILTDPKRPLVEVADGSGYAEGGVVEKAPGITLDKLKKAKKRFEGDWIEHDGGWCPAKPHEFVDVKFRDGTIHHNRADTYSWAHYGATGDIIAWRYA